MAVRCCDETNHAPTARTCELDLVRDLSTLRDMLRHQRATRATLSNLETSVAKESAAACCVLMSSASPPALSSLPCPFHDILHHATLGARHLESSQLQDKMTGLCLCVLLACIFDGQHAVGSSDHDWVVVTGNQPLAASHAKLIYRIAGCVSTLVAHACTNTNKLHHVATIGAVGPWHRGCIGGTHVLGAWFIDTLIRRRTPLRSTQSPSSIAHVTHRAACLEA